ncbi:polysaccharide deacetylase [Marvinbryantia formatexigens DSM 14469]|uniref:Polysaccharide deacetylase n=1 Tax=Marvinbryantia formatexigens DSM 14469 TaxID=478749 RepID=C6LB92_9FIRM|nr:polysaccharide deacetylase family protein [Marvinbryantia formatexigens]EET62223.1 polysaccharide deacetylase [Marvinbryantia formatexigens DSM 14469]UWO26448.1 polysaccharide deacetylase family protein [Marvinbryantia formatexigens DSM 14469]SDF80442.1 Peptidoglycan/xylan/chitin deacetylase, PgdA/CDA1 family [Marvinbryantia formatexigens]
MKTRKRLFLSLCVLVLALVAPAALAQAKTTNAVKTELVDVRKAVKPQGKWVKRTGGYKFRLASSGKAVKNKWISVDGKVYYVNGSGYRVSGWVKYRGKLYYMDKNGVMQTGWLTVSGKKYYMKPNGVALKKLQKIGDARYYFSPTDASMKKGWVSIGKSKYYFSKIDGRMRTATWVKSDGKYRYVGQDGKMLSSCWVIVGKNKYYVDGDGVRVTGTQYIGNKGYYFKSNGVYDPTVKVKMEVNPNKKMVALTFDDGPGPYTTRLLNCLQKNGAKATFFMVGSSVPNYKSAVKKMVAMGCELGNHSYSHPAFTTLSYSSRRSQVTRTNNNIYNACGKYPTVFRLPYGDGHNSSSVLSSLGLPSIYWSLDTRDWANTGSPQHTVNAVLNNVKNGDIVLMHDIHRSTVDAAETIIPALKKRGFQMVTVSQLAKYKGKTTLRSGKTYYSFK